MSVWVGAVFACDWISCGGQKRSLKTLDLDLQAVGSHLMRVPRTRLRISINVAHALNHEIISLVPILSNF